MNDSSRDLAALCELLDKDALAAAKQCKSLFQKSAKTHNEQLYETIAFLCAHTRKLALCEQDHAAFFEQDFWQRKPQNISGKRLVRLAVRYMLGAKQCKGALYEQARSYAEVVIFFNKKAVDPQRIPAILKTETLYTILDKHQAKTASGSSSAEVLSAEESVKRTAKVASRYTRDAVKGSVQSQRVTEDAAENPNQFKGHSVRSFGRDLRMTFNPRTDIYFDGAQYQNAILSLPVGQVFDVRCLRLPDSEGVQKFKILKYEESSSS